MTNASVSDAPSVALGTIFNPNITTLVELKVYDDKPTAEAATPNPIYVERAVAKVNVKVSNSGNMLTIKDGETFAGSTVTFSGWVLQNTNKKTYLIRNVGIGENAPWKQWIGYYNNSVSNKANRFVGTTPSPVPHVLRYRS